MRSDELYHYGIKGQKWGTRRYQNADGSYTDEGKRRYGRGSGGRRIGRYDTSTDGGRRAKRDVNILTAVGAGLGAVNGVRNLSNIYKSGRMNIYRQTIPNKKARAAAIAAGLGLSIGGNALMSRLGAKAGVGINKRLYGDMSPYYERKSNSKSKQRVGSTKISLTEQLGLAPHSIKPNKDTYRPDRVYNLDGTVNATKFRRLATGLYGAGGALNGANAGYALGLRASGGNKNAALAGAAAGGVLGGAGGALGANLGIRGAQRLNARLMRNTTKNGRSQAGYRDDNGTLMTEEYYRNRKLRKSRGGR